MAIALSLASSSLAVAKQQSMQRKRDHRGPEPGLTEVSGGKKSLPQGKFSESHITGPVAQESRPR